jgi:hypothetical protein
MRSLGGNFRDSVPAELLCVETCNKSTNEISPDWLNETYPAIQETLYNGQFDWGGGLLKSNGGAQR